MINRFRVDTPSSSTSSAEKSTTSPAISLASLVPESPQPGSPTPESSRKRSHFTEEMKVSLVRLCIQHQTEYARRRKSKFWADISTLFEAQTGVPVRKPGQTVECLIRERRQQLVYRSGVAGSDTELKQALDIFMQRYDEVEKEEHDLSAQKEELAETKRRTMEMRDQMMEGGRRRSNDDDDGDCDDVDSSASEQQQAAPKIKRSRLSRNDVLASSLRSSTNTMATALNSSMQVLASALQQAPGTADAACTDDSRFDRLTELELQLFG
ncbi:hypothetical protein V1525DRAFT_415396, partial [Lipomyces kononenkoae]